MIFAASPAQLSQPSKALMISRASQLSASDERVTKSWDTEHIRTKTITTHEKHLDNSVCNSMQA